MSKRSAASLEVAAISIPTRPDPPKGLNKNEAKIWRDVVANKPPDWFKADIFPLLIAYCRASDNYQRLSAEINQIPMGMGMMEVLKEYLAMQEKQARLLAGLATKMRITQQSRYNPDSASTANKRAGASKKPWES